MSAEDTWSEIKFHALRGSGHAQGRERDERKRSNILQGWYQCAQGVPSHRFEGIPSHRKSRQRVLLPSVGRRGLGLGFSPLGPLSRARARRC